jgi:hypothetical protein
MELLLVEVPEVRTRKVLVARSLLFCASLLSPYRHSRAMFAAMRLASSFVVASPLIAALIRIIHVGNLVSVRISHDVVVRLDFGRPGCGEVVFEFFG